MSCAKRVLADAKRLQELLQQDLAGMCGRKLGAHNPQRSTCRGSVTVCPRLRLIPAIMSSSVMSLNSSSRSTV